MAINAVTVFGGTGFVGRQIIRRLAQTGAAIRVPTRNADRVLPLRPMGEVGQIVALQWDGRNLSALEKLVGDVDCVINLIGILAERRAGDFQSLQAKLPGHIASVAMRQKVGHFIQMSAIGADANSPSEYAQTKAAGEQSVLEAFPSATILRPSIIFGPGDGFFSLFANMSRFSPMLPLIAGGHTKFQPVYVGDVAEATSKVMVEVNSRGQTFELGGPKVYSFQELLRYTLTVIDRRRLLIPIPMGIARLQARLAEMLPNPPLTRDQLRLLQRDNVVSSDAKGLEDLMIRPTPLELVVPEYLSPYSALAIKAPIV